MSSEPSSDSDDFPIARRAAADRRAGIKRKPRFSFSVPPEGLDAAYGVEYGESVERFVLEWAGLTRDEVFGKVARNRRAAEGLERKLAELEAEFERDLELGLNGNRPSKWAAAGDFAAEDIVAHPDDYPPDYRLKDGSLNPRLERSAADLVLKRIAALHRKPL